METNNFPVHLVTQSGTLSLYLFEIPGTYASLFDCISLNPSVPLILYGNSSAALFYFVTVASKASILCRSSTCYYSLYLKGWLSTIASIYKHFRCETQLVRVPTLRIRSNHSRLHLVSATDSICSPNCWYSIKVINTLRLLTFLLE